VETCLNIQKVRGDLAMLKLQLIAKFRVILALLATGLAGPPAIGQTPTPTPIPLTEGWMVHQHCSADSAISWSSDATYRLQCIDDASDARVNVEVSVRAGASAQGYQGNGYWLDGESGYNMAEGWWWEGDGENMPYDEGGIVHFEESEQVDAWVGLVMGEISNLGATYGILPVENVLIRQIHGSGLTPAGWTIYSGSAPTFTVFAEDWADGGTYLHEVGHRGAGLDYELPAGYSHRIMYYANAGARNEVGTGPQSEDEKASFEYFATWQE
jgi:hypothetical protein